MRRDKVDDTADQDQAGRDELPDHSAKAEMARSSGGRDGPRDSARSRRYRSGQQLWTDRSACLVLVRIEVQGSPGSRRPQRRAATYP